MGAQKHEGMQLHPQCEQGKPRVPKKEGAINPINPRGELVMLEFPQGKNRALWAHLSSV